MKSIEGKLYSELKEKCISSFPLNGDRICFKIPIPKDKKKSIVIPFIKGKYSEIDRGYVKENFPEKVYKGSDIFGKSQYETLINYKILTKHQDLREYWENRLDCNLPENAEVWPIPEKHQEIYAYDKKNLEPYFKSN